MTLSDVKKQLVDGIEDCYSDDEHKFIERRLGEIQKDNNLSPEELNDLCWEDSVDVFSLIFDYIDTDPQC